MKSAKTAPGVEAVLVPGEPERRNLAQRSRDGVGIPEDTVEILGAGLADRYGVPMPASL